MTNCLIKDSYELFSYRNSKLSVDDFVVKINRTVINNRKENDLKTENFVCIH